MLKTLTLTNFQQHAERTFEFSTGLNLVTGDNWSGKTTVLRGILFALFGSSAVDAKAIDLTTRGQSGMQVRLVIELDDKEYVVSRSRTTADIQSGGTKLASGQAETTREVERLLNTTAKHFKLLNLSPQGEADALFSMGSAAMSTLLNEITGADLVDAVLSASAERAASFAWGTNTYESLAVRTSETAKKLGERQSEHDELDTWMAQAKLHQTYLLDRVAGAKKAVSGLENSFIQAEMVRRELAELESRLEHSNQMLAQIDKELVPVKQEDLEELKTRRDALRASIDNDTRNRERIADLHRDRDNYLDTLKKLGDARTPLPEDAPSLDELQASKLRHDTALADATALVKQLTTTLSNAVCPTCGSVVSEVDLDNVRASLETAEREKELRVQEHADFMRHYTDQCKMRASHDALQKDLRNAERALAALEDELVPLEAVCNAVDHTVVNRNHLLELENAYDELAYAARLYTEKVTNRTRHQQRHAADLARKAELEATGPWPTESEVLAARATRDSAIADEEHWSAVVNEQVTRLAVLANETKSLSENLRRDLADQERAKEAHQSYLGYKELEKYLRQNRDRYLADIWASILSYASRFINEATSGKVTALGRAHNGFFYTEDGFEMPVSLASGMQKAVLGIALKLALGAALGAGRKLLLLDEATAAASDENSMLVCQLLAGYSGQVVMVSHRSADAAVADHAISLT